MKGIYVIIAAAIMSSAFAAESNNDISKQQNVQEELQNKSNALKAYEVGAVRQMFQENAIQAEDEMLDKTILLCGKFYSVTNDSEGYELKLDYLDDNPFTYAMQCDFSKSERSTLKALKKGDILIVKGKLTRQYGGEKLTECSIYKLNPPKEDIKVILKNIRGNS